ncbi:MAG: PEP/pyruvate-binding domain-containing protein [Acidimicrobiia bacterium]
MTSLGGQVLWLEECDGASAERVGGKAVGLGALIRQELQVPPGFAVTTDAYRECVVASGLQDEIARLLDGADEPEAVQCASEKVRALFDDRCVGPAVAAEIVSAYETLMGRQAAAAGPPAVAVRSSATAEDRAEASFAGQQESYLWVQGVDQVVHHVARCWGSLFTPQAISYRARLGVPLEGLAMGVVVQQMVPAEAAGVMITLDPVSGDRSQISIESSYGLGLAVVGGEVNPDRFSVDKVMLTLRSQHLSAKHIAYRYDADAGGVVLVDVPEAEQSLPSLATDEVLAVAALGTKVERSMGGPQDVEWAVAPGTGGEREVFLLQTRPETVWSQRTPAAVSSTGTGMMDRLLRTISTPTRLTDVASREGDSPC